ncbi:MAG: ribbon-helix-helix domain-containing protein [Maricaulaceae bacterium]
MSLIKRSLSIYGHQTSLAIEAQYWTVIDFIAARDEVSVSALIKTLDDERIAQKYGRGLAAYIRVWAINLIIHDDAVRDHLQTVLAQN